MNVNLTPQLDRLVKEKVQSGMYGSASEVVREALRKMFHTEGTGVNTVAEASPPVYKAGKERSFTETMKWIRESQKARGHVPPTKEEVDAYIKEIRSGWDR